MRIPYIIKKKFCGFFFFLEWFHLLFQQHKMSAVQGENIVMSSQMLPWHWCLVLRKTAPDNKCKRKCGVLSAVSLFLLCTVILSFGCAGNAVCPSWDKLCQFIDKYWHHPRILLADTIAWNQQLWMQAYTHIHTNTDIYK